MTTVDSLFKEAKCVNCLKVLPVERVHLFRNVRTPSMIESLAFCSKDCEIDFSMKETAGLAKAFLMSMDELSENNMQVIEKKFKVARQRTKNGERKMRTIKCTRCGHLWLTTSTHRMVSCPSCLGKTPNMSMETPPVKKRNGGKR